MFTYNKENAKLNLQGRLLKSFSVILFSFLSFAFFLLSSFCCVFLFIIDTSFLENIGIFENEYIHAVVCIAAVIENLILFLLYIYIKLRKDCYFYSLEENLNVNISMKMVFKALYLYTLCFLKKITAFMLFSCPFILLSTLIIKQLQQGISYSSLILLTICDMIFFFFGRYSFSVYIQKYHLLTYVFVKYDSPTIREIFSISSYKMNGRCKALVSLKAVNFFKKLLCVFIFPAVYYLPYCKMVEIDFVLEKEKPYMRRKAYTEKPIVFYFKPIKEN